MADPIRKRVSDALDKAGCPFNITGNDKPTLKKMRFSKPGSLVESVVEYLEKNGMDVESVDIFVGVDAVEDVVETERPTKKMRIDYETEFYRTPAPMVDHYNEYSNVDKRERLWHAFKEKQAEIKKRRDEEFHEALDSTARKLFWKIHDEAEELDVAVEDMLEKIMAVLFEH